MTLLSLSSVIWECNYWEYNYVFNSYVIVPVKSGTFWVSIILIGKDRDVP